MAIDFEGILNYFRATLPRRFGSEEESKLLFSTAYSFKITQRKLKKLEKDYKAYLEHQASLEDPTVRLEVTLPQLLWFVDFLAAGKQAASRYGAPLTGRE